MAEKATKLKKNNNPDFWRQKLSDGGKSLLKKYEKILDFNILDDKIQRVGRDANDNFLDSPLLSNIKREEKVDQQHIPDSLLMESGVMLSSGKQTKHRKYNSLPKLSMHLKEEAYLNNHSVASSKFVVQKSGMASRRYENESESNAASEKEKKTYSTKGKNVDSSGFIREDVLKNDDLMKR